MNMTNKEYYKEKILDIACMGSTIAVDKRTREIQNCKDLSNKTAFYCGYCLFNKDNYRSDCNEERLKWANAEYIEKSKLTKNEKLFLSLLKEEWKYMARDKDGDLLIYNKQPFKNIDVWNLAGGNYVCINNLLLDSCKFTMVKWRDEKPWLIEDLKRLSVEE